MKKNESTNPIECLTVGIIACTNPEDSRQYQANELFTNRLKNYSALTEQQITMLQGKKLYGPIHACMIPGKNYKWVYWPVNGLCLVCEDSGIRGNADCEEMLRVPIGEIVVIVTKPKGLEPSLVLPCVCTQIDFSCLTYTFDFLNGYLDRSKTMSFSAYDIDQVLIYRGFDLKKDVKFQNVGTGMPVKQIAITSKARLITDSIFQQAV